MRVQRRIFVCTIMLCLLCFIFFKFSKMITLLLNYMVMLVLTSNLGVWCVLLIFVYCEVLLLMEKGNGELVVGFMNVVAMGMQIWW